MQPVTRYAKSGDIHIAYQVFGEGPINLVIVPGFVSNIENYWEERDLARRQLRMASYARAADLGQCGMRAGGSGAAAIGSIDRRQVIPLCAPQALGPIPRARPLPLAVAIGPILAQPT